MANRLSLIRSGAVCFIDWLDLFRYPIRASDATTTVIRELNKGSRRMCAYWATHRREAMPLPLQPASIPPNSPSNPYEI